MIKKTICAVLVAGVLITGTGILPAQNIYAKEENGQAYCQYETVADNTFEIGQVDNFSGVSTYAATSSASGTWIKASNGKWWYKHADGSCTKNGWEQIDGKWYHFDENGWMQTGWLKIGTKWYYLESTGEMRIGWLNLNDKWYYFLGNGEMNTGWLNRNYIWYYFDDTTGVMVTGWRKINDNWYYFLENGYMNKKPLTLKSRYYKFTSSGKMYLTEILVKRQTQESNKWCWAASAVMIGTYYTNSNITQRETVKYVKGSTKYEGGTDYEVIKAINYSSNFTKSSSKVKPLKYKKYIEKIDDNHPVALHISWYSGGGHMVVGAGYDSNSRAIRVIDPWAHTKTTYYDYASVINGTRFLTGSGRCTSMIVY